MNGMDNILRRIREDAQRETDAMRQEAQAQADALLEQGRARAEAILAQGREENAALAQRRKTRLLSAANMEARQTVLFTKQTYIDEAFSLAFHRIQSLPWTDYAEYLARWIAQAAETGTEAIILSELHREKMGQLVLERANALREDAAFTLSNETRDIQGVILRQGNVEINGTLEYRFRLLREQMASDVAQLLFQ